jgi:hypothetical protein
MAASMSPVAVTRGWIPRTDVPWLEELRMWHVGQVGAWDRTRRALDHARGEAYADCREDERLAAEELGRIIGEVARLVCERAGDPATASVDVSDDVAAGVRAWLHLDVETAVAA